MHMRIQSHLYMDAISTSFLHKPPQITNISSIRFQNKTQKKNTTSFFSTYDALKLIISYKKKLNTISRKTNKWLPNIFRSFEDFICTHLDSPLRPSIDPIHVLSGNFAPVDELPPTVCEVMEGTLPSCLDGVYIRNGPNPQFPPLGPYHQFDGDGMLHVIKISRGQATFCNRYVKTYKFLVESGMGYPIFPSPFSSFNGPAASMARLALTIARLVTGHFNPIANGFGSANTSLALIGGRLFALGESDLPYAIQITQSGDIVTIGRHNFFSDKPFFSMTAHPKIDPDTREVFAFRYNAIKPFLSIFRIDPKGKKQPDVPIFSMKTTSLIHDFGVTKNFVIFSDTQTVMDLFEIIRGRPPVNFNSSKVSRLGILPRYAKDESEMWWIDAPGFNMLHCFNAWEENDGDIIVMVASNLSSVQVATEIMDLAKLVLVKIVIDVKGKSMKAYPLSNKILDLGGINPAYAGKKNRYVYLTVIDLPLNLIGVVKLDLTLSSEDSQDCAVACRLYGPNCTGSEPFFVPRESNNPETDEDDGFLVTYVHDMDSGESRFLVMDAKSPTLETIAAVKLPGRVPYGFHGLFVKENDLGKP